MTLRTFILLRITPIFLALAAANAAALYWAQSAEIDANLAEETEAASVTLSEYLAAKPELAHYINSARGRSALSVAMAQMPGLKSIAVIREGDRCCILQAGRSLDRRVEAPSQPMRPSISGVLQRASGEQFIRSTVRLPRGDLLTVEIDADRSLAERYALIWRSSLILIAGGLAGLFVSLIITGWLSRDLRSLQNLIGSREAIQTRTRFVETQDVADAVVMLRANLATVAELKKQRLKGPLGSAINRSAG